VKYNVSFSLYVYCLRKSLLIKHKKDRSMLYRPSNEILVSHTWSI